MKVFDSTWNCMKDFGSLWFIVGMFLCLIGMICCGQNPIGAPASRVLSVPMFDTVAAKGTWISAGDQHVGFFVDKGRRMPVIALDSQANKGAGHEFAISLYKGKPTLQVVQGDDVVILDLFEAAKALEKLIQEDGRDPRQVGTVGAEDSSPPVVNQTPGE